MTRSRDLANLADSTEFTAALNTKLNAVEASSDVTDTANVTAAGALMDSELTNLAAVKAINQSLVTTASPTFAGLGVNGTVTSDGLTVDGDLSVTSANSRIRLYETDTTDLNTQLQNQAGDFNIARLDDDAGASTVQLNIDHATGNVSIPNGNLDVTGTVTADGLTVTRSGNGDIAQVKTSGGNGLVFSSPSSTTLQIASIQGSKNLDLWANTLSFSAGGSTSMSINSAGRVLIGTDQVDVGFTDSGSGVAIWEDGLFQAARSSAYAVGMFNKLDNDGQIVEFYKDGSVVGSIGTNGGYIHVGSDDVNLRFHAAANAILPATTGGATRNSAIDLGTSGAKYKDLYLSGGVYLGGTGSANKISEYEIGSWTPVIKGNASGNNATMITADARYTKVGSLLYVSAFLNTINFGAITSGTHVVLTGLPYAAQADYYAPIVFGHNNTNLTDGYVETNGLVYLEINGTETQQSANAITGDRFMIGITMNLNE